METEGSPSSPTVLGSSVPDAMLRSTSSISSAMKTHDNEEESQTRQGSEVIGTEY